MLLHLPLRWTLSREFKRRLSLSCGLSVTNRPLVGVRWLSHRAASRSYTWLWLRRLPLRLACSIFKRPFRRIRLLILPPFVVSMAFPCCGRAQGGEFPSQASALAVVP